MRIVYTFQEAECRPRAIAELAQGLGFSESTVEKLIANLNRRIRQRLVLERDPLAVSSQGELTVDSISGAMRLSPLAEIEIVPKFLNRHARYWREDFYIVASMSRFGRLLSHERLASKRASNVSIADLVARAFIELWDQLARLPYRRYSPRDTWSFTLSGTYEALDLIQPSAIGIRQSQITLDQNNPVNYAILEAARCLVQQRVSTSTRDKLLFIASHLQPQSRPRLMRRQTLSSRYSKWQHLYELSLDVLDSYGYGYGDGPFQAPGFLVKTWQSWQHLCFLVLQAGMTGFSVRQTPQVWFGRRLTSDLNVYPDILIESSRGKWVIDAKYKGDHRRKPSVSNSDIYEILAFVDATGAESGILLYPEAPSINSSNEAGHVEIIDVISVQKVKILAITVSISGISGNGGVEQFVSNLSGAIKEFIFS